MIGNRRLRWLGMGYVVALILLVYGGYATMPHIMSGYCKEGGSEIQGIYEECGFPVRIMSENTHLRVRVPVVLQSIYPTRYHIDVAGCLQALTVNGIPVEVHSSSCDTPLGKTVQLQKYLRPGVNEFLFDLEHSSEPFIIHRLTLRPALFDTVIFALLVPVLVLFGLLLFSIARLFRIEQTIVLIFGLGALLRILYVAATSYAIRSFDWQSHLFYIRYISEHMALPPASLAWETYQPPLYYLMMGFWHAVHTFFGRSDDRIVFEIQLFSLLCSIGALYFIVQIASELFRGTVDRRYRFLFLFLVLTQPALIFFSSRISNDALSHLLLFALLLSVIRFFSGERLKDWQSATVFTGFSLITKLNALLFLPVLWTAPFLRGMQIRRSIMLVVFSFGLIAIISAWFFVLRFGFESQTSIIGNIDKHREEIFMQDAYNPLQLVWLNPIRVLVYPYNNQWDDASGRKNFPEYFLRSMYAGDFSFGTFLVPLVILLLMVTMALIPYGLYGIYAARHHWAWNILLSVFLVFLIGHMVYRFLLPTATTQDIRFTIILLVPMAFFLLEGIRACPRILRLIGEAGVVLLSALSMILVLSLIVVSQV